MTEGARTRGIAAYSRYIRLYLLHSAFEAMRGAEAPPPPARAALVGDGWQRTLSAHAAALGAAEAQQRGFEWTSALQLAAAYAAALGEEASLAAKAKAKDDERGRRVIPDYGASHASAEVDPVIAALRARARDVAAEVLQWHTDCGVPVPSSLLQP
jgi:hypothetical protein